MATAAELTGEEIAAVAASLSDPANLNVDTMAAIMHRIGPGLWHWDRRYWWRSSFS